MISKELLSEVLKIEVKHIGDKNSRFLEFYSPTICNLYKDMRTYHRDYGYAQSINIHELAHKCKEWANKDILFGYFITSFISKDYAQCTAIPNSKLNSISKVFEAKTEPEAIFKACQWILDNELQNGRA